MAEEIMVAELEEEAADESQKGQFMTFQTGVLWHRYQLHQ